MKKVLSLLLVLVFLLGLLPGMAMAGGEVAGTLQFSYDLPKEYVLSQAGLVYDWGNVAVGTYTPDGGEAMPIPSGVNPTKVWYQSTDGVNWNADPYMPWSYIESACYYKVEASAEIDGQTYTGTSTVVHVLVRAADIKVNFTLSDAGLIASDTLGSPVANQSITVVDLNADGKHTYDEALSALHKASAKNGTDDYDTKEGAYGLQVKKLWGKETTAALFYQNSKALEKNVGEATVSANDKLYAAILCDTTYYADVYTAFNAASKDITLGQTCELTLTDISGNPVPDVQIGTLEDGNFVALDGKKTDANGKVVVKPETAGTLYITAKGTVKADVVTEYNDDGTPKTTEKLDCPIMAPACVVTTHEAGELTVAVSTKTAQLEYYVGESSSLNYRFTVSYKIDGKSDSAITNRAKNKIEYWRIAVDKDGNETGEAEKIANISAKFTEADKGMWHYFAKTTVDAYGIEMTAESEKLPVLITEESLQGSCANGFVTELIYQKDSNLQEKLTITEGTTDFDIEELDMSDSESIMLFADNEKAAGDTFYFGYRVDGKQTRSSGDSNYRPTDGASLDFRMANSYQAKPAGTVVTYSVLIGTKYDSDGDGSISGKDHYKACDIYNFRTITKPSFSGLAVADADGNAIALDAPITSFVNGSALGTASDMIKLTPTLGTGVTMYIGNEETGYASGETATVNLSVYKNEKDVAVIPLTLKAGSGEAAIENAYTLHVHPVIETPVITKQSENVSVDKGKTVKISVEAKEPAEGTLEYQWYTYASDGWTVVAIEGATSAEYDAPSLERVHQYEWQNSQTFWCEVSVVSGDYKNTVKSNNVTVTTNMTYVSEPLFTIQPGILGDKNMNGSYVKTYTAGSSFNSMFFGISNPEPGCTNAAFKCFYNNTDTTDGGTEIPGTYSLRMTGGNFDNYYEFQPSMTLPEGTYYVYFTAETHLDKDEQQTATAKSKTVKLEFEPYKIPFDGSGTEIDPFLIKTAGDMDTLSELVGIQGINFGGSYLRMENDITLSTGWTPVGRLKDSNITGIKDGTNMNAFGGVFDGNGHTLTIPENEAPAFGYVRGATIRNLNIYGTKINGYGLINNMEGVHLDGTAVIVDNVTLKSGTQTRFSGITGSRCTESPYAGVSAGYVTTIKNCTIEEGCVIGYEGTQTGIGSFAGRLQGTVENCVSYAEVKGADYVGGIIGTRDNALGNCNVKNCEFYGTVAGTNNVGGIVGGGYYDMTTDHNTAPNADRIDITGCTFGGTVKGTKNVGGIIGGDEYVAQLWDKGVLTGNKATGKIEGSVNVGAIIGHYFSLNKFDEISGNIYAEECGVEKGIGKIDYIDTNCSAPTAVSGTTYINTENGTSGCPAVEGCNWKPQHNRTDDPLGADAEKLCRVSEDAEPVCYELVMTGTPKTEYYIGDEIDLTGLTFTAKWTQGKEDTTVNASELTVEGFDSSTRKVMDVTVKYGDTSTTFTVTVLNRPDPTASTITVYLTLLGDTLHEGDNTIHTLTGGNLTTWIARESYEMDINATVKDLLGAVEKRHSNVKFNGKGSQYGTYIESVTYGDLTIGEFDNTSKSGWMYTLNGTHPGLGVAEQKLKNGDAVVFHFTDDYTQEQGSESWGGGSETGSGGSSGGGGGGSASGKQEGGTTESERTQVGEDQSEVAVETTVESVSISGEITAVNGEAALSLKSEDVTAAIAAIPADSEQKTLEIKPIVSGESSSVSVSLPAEAVGEIAGSEITVNVVTEDAAITIPADTLSEIVSQGEGDVKIEVKKADTATIADRVEPGLLENATVVEINITVGEQSVTHFGGSMLTLNIPVSAERMKENGVYPVIAVSDDGSVDYMTGTVVNREGVYTLEVISGHLTKFAVLEQETVRFSDVKTGSYYESAVNWAVLKGITVGTGADSFSPESTCTRAQLVTFLWRSLGKPETEASGCGFADVAEDSYYAAAVRWAFEQGITCGVDATHFAPDAVCQRGQMAAFLYRCSKAEPVEGANPFTDVEADSVFAPAILWAAENGIAKGVTESAFAPSEACTRGQIVTFLYRWLVG